MTPLWPVILNTVEKILTVEFDFEGLSVVEFILPFLTDLRRVVLDLGVVEDVIASGWWYCLSHKTVDEFRVVLWVLCEVFIEDL